MKKNINAESFTFENYKYTYVQAKGNYRFDEVHCWFKCNGKPVIIYYLYPRYLLENKEQYIKKAKKFIKTITENGEIYAYCKNYLDPKSAKAYKFKTPYGFENIVNINEVIDRIKYNHDEKIPVKYKAVTKKAKTTGKSKKVLIGITSGIAVASTALAVYFYLNRNKGGTVIDDKAVITFNAGDGYIDGTKDHSKVLKVDKGTNWKTVKKNSPKADSESGTFNYWSINNQPIADNYAFNSDITINADYKIYTFDVTVNSAGGIFNDGTNDPKTINNVKYGTTWKSLVDEHQDLKIKEAPTGMEFSTYKDSDNSDVTNKDYVFKSKGNKINVSATYALKGFTVITFSAGAGTFNDGKGAFTSTFEKNVTWATAKAKVEGKSPTLTGHTHNNKYKIGTTDLIDSYVFNDSSAVVTAVYTADKFDVIAKANGGTFIDDKDTKTLSVEYGKKWSEIKGNFTIKTLPENKKGLFKFKIDGSSSYVEDETIITKALNITAEYIEQDQYVLTIDAMGGTLETGASAKSDLVYKGSLWSKYKPATNPTCANKTFSMWTIDGTTAVDDNHQINATEKIYALYTETKVTVTVKANGGQFSDGSTEKTEEVNSGSKWDDIASKYVIKDTSYPTDKTFDVYRVSTETGTVATNYTFVTNTTIIASYKSKPSINITLDADGGSFEDSSSAKTLPIITGQTWGAIKSSLPKNPTKDGYDFENWYLDKASPSTKIEDSKVFTDSITIFANYKVKELTITMSAGASGKFDEGVATSPKVKYGSTWGELNTYNETKKQYLYKITETDPTNYSFVYFKYYKTGESATTAQFIDDKHAFIEDTTIEAYYDPAGSSTVVIDPNGGTFKDDTTDVKFATGLTLESGKKWSVLKPIIESEKGSIEIKTAPTGYTLDNYKYKDSTGALQVLTDDSLITSSLVITATYSPNTVAVTLNSGTGGSYTGDVTTKNITPNYGSYYQESSKPDIIKEGYEFAYYVVGDTTTKVDTNHKYTVEETLNAKYYVTLKFDAGEGKLPGANTIKVMQGTKWSSIKDAFKPTAKSTDYTFKAYKIGDDEIGDDDTFNAPATLKANYTLNNPSNFTTDSWDKFTQIVSKGYDFISTKDRANGGYKEDLDNNNGTFVGLTRTINIAGVNQTVRVIGQNTDTISGSTNKAALTFEFVNTITTSEYSLNEGYVSWSNSSLRDKLQKQVYNLMPSELLNTTYGIKSVDKSTYNSETKSTDTSSDKLFVLSASEMGYNKFPDYQLDVKSEGSKYAYFGTTTPAIKKNASYWIRSTDLLVKGFTWAIDENGNLGIKNASTELFESRANDATCGVAPCFAI